MACSGTAFLCINLKALRQDFIETATQVKPKHIFPKPTKIHVRYTGISGKKVPINKK
jgi:hypothetical protein